MPLYEYRCAACEHQFEVIQSFSDKPLRKCPKCGSKVEKLISRSGFVLKGGGWYKSDYAPSKPSGASESSESDAPAAASAATSGDSKDSKDSKDPKADSKPASTAEAKPEKKPAKKRAARS